VEHLARFHESGHSKLATAIRTRFKLCSSGVPVLSSGNANFDTVVVHFLSGMMACIGYESRCKYILDNNFDDAMATWLEVFEIFCICRSKVGQKYTPKAFSDTSTTTWKAFLHSRLHDHGLEEPELHLKLMELENIHGAYMRKHFPPAVLEPQISTIALPKGIQASLGLGFVRLCKALILKR